MKNDNTVLLTTLTYIFVVAIAAAIVFGYAISTVHHTGKDAVMEQFQDWSLQEQQDFVIAAIKYKHSIRRAVSEDWCAINKNTQRVCWNARMLAPVEK